MPTDVGDCDCRPRWRQIKLRDGSRVWHLEPCRHSVATLPDEDLERQWKELLAAAERESR